MGLAVKQSSEDLARALQAAMNGLMAAGTVGQFFKQAKVGWRQP